MPGGRGLVNTARGDRHKVPVSRLSVLCHPVAPVGHRRAVARAVLGPPSASHGQPLAVHVGVLSQLRVSVVIRGQIQRVQRGDIPRGARQVRRLL